MAKKPYSTRSKIQGQKLPYSNIYKQKVIGQVFTSSLVHVKIILDLVCAFEAHSSCILLAFALVVGPLARCILSTCYSKQCNI